MQSYIFSGDHRHFSTKSPTFVVPAGVVTLSRLYKPNHISSYDSSIVYTAFFGNLRGWQFIIVVLVILLLFGGKKIPEMMRGLGKGVASFRQGLDEARREINKATDTDASDGKKPEKE